MKKEFVLNEEQANFIRDVMAAIGGCPSLSRRKMADDISDELDKAGFHGTTLLDFIGSVAFSRTKNEQHSE